MQSSGVGPQRQASSKAGTTLLGAAIKTFAVVHRVKKAAWGSSTNHARHWWRSNRAKASGLSESVWLPSCLL